MRVRVLYPTAVSRIYADREVEAGDLINIADADARALIADGAVEEAKPRRVEAATKAPGEKRTTRKKTG